MEQNDALMMGMFWGGLIMAAVPILLTVGVGVYVLRRTLQGRRENGAEGGEREEPRIRAGA